MSRGVRAAVVICTAVIAAATPASASAATIKVTTAVDEFGQTGAKCGLREAVEAANTNAPFGGCEAGSGADKVTVRGGKTYELALPGIDDVNAAGDLDLIGELTLEARKRGRATVDAGGIDRAIDVRPNARLTVSGLRITGGAVTTIENGAGILSQGRLEVRRSAVVGNQIPGGGGSGEGGGIASIGGRTILNRASVTGNVLSSLGSGGGLAQIGGSLRIKDSTVAGNTAYGGGGVFILNDTPASIKATTISGNTDYGEQYGGGGLYAYDGSGKAIPVRLTNVTISGNRSYGRGGGVYAGGNADLHLNAVTVADNIGDFDGDGVGTISGSGGGIHGAANFENSIVAGNFASNAGAEDCYETSGGEHNVVGRDTGCDNPDVGTANPRLGPLAKNGGPTKTHALKRRSPAIGKAGGSAPGRDQRGRKRDRNPDAGAFERGA